MAQRNRTAQGVLAALLAGTVALTACSPPTSASGSANSGGSTKALTVWLQQKPDTASALLSGTYGNSEILSVTQDQLVSVAADGTLEPRAATKWNLSADAKSLTLNLADQKWSDGSPFTADDVVFTLNLYTNPAVKSPLTTVLKPIAGYDEVASGAAKELSGVKKVDDHTVRIDLKNPDVGFMYTLFGATIYVLQKAALSKEDPATVASSQIWITPGKVPGLGPFTLSSYVPGQRAEFAKNPNFRKPVEFDRMVQTLVTQDVATQQLSSGEMDVALVAPTDVATVQGMQSKGVGTVSNEVPGFDRYTVNQRKEYLKEPKVRQGLLTAIDRVGIIKSVYAGQAKPINSSFTSSKVVKDGFATYDYSPTKAKQLLTEAGWDFNREFVIREVNNNAQRQAIDQVVLKNLQDVGVKATIKPVDQAQVTDMLTKGDYDIFLYGGGNYTADPSTNIPMITCANAFPKGANLPAYCDSKVDDLLSQAATSTDEAKRGQLLTQAGKLENADVSHLWIAQPTRVYAFSSKVTGGVRGGDGMFNMLMSVQDWKVK
ncbi:ABC transporter substrate-binding protein [Arthrobacter sp. KBS0702]|uniref:ABC transporter substrate-binding protein n=1 Tax=Arthrobacter sp. KBS0702 TaxID=2578107 RepID=UPI00110EE4EC|nr:ABC transporter substrate-binding protein [Arthrobacter sp. KBS0702]QDW30634.1 ABC transporter substrate-binding protein [Arthrobacter sp. KBS0702]